MFVALLKEWLENEQEGKADEISMLTALELKDFAEWLDTRNPTTRAAAKASGALCSECDSEILEDGYCMMGHWCGTPRSGG